MQRSVCVAAVLGLGFVAATVPLGLADGTTVETFRILGSGDYGAVALTSSCGNSDYPAPPSGVDPDPDDPEGTAFRALDAVFGWECWAVRGAGYDGETAAAWDASGHEDDPFVCRASSVAGPASISVDFSYDHDPPFGNERYPNTIWRPLDEYGIEDHTLANDGGNYAGGGIDLPNAPTGQPEVDRDVPDGLNPGFRDGYLVTALLRGGVFWDEVSGVVLGSFAVIHVHVGTDVTVTCTF